MTDTRPPVQKLLEEVRKNVRLRERVRTEQARADRLARVIAEQNRMLLGVWLRGRLIDPSIFTRYVDVARCTDTDGRLLWSELDRAMDELLADHPAFATRRDDPGSHDESAVKWFPAEE